MAVAVPLKPETKNGHMQTRMARKLTNGNYIVPHLLAFAVKEYKPDGTVVRTIRTDLEELGDARREIGHSPPFNSRGKPFGQPDQRQQDR